MSWFNNEVAEEATKEYAQSFVVQTGEFPVKLDLVYMVSSQSSKAQGIRIEFSYESNKKGDTTIWFIDKDTGTQVKSDGKPTFGSMVVPQFFGAFEKDANEFKTTPSEIKSFGKDITADVFRELTGQMVRVVIQSVDKVDNRDGSVSEVPEVIGWFNMKTRLSFKEWQDKATEPKEIEGAIKRSMKHRKSKDSKTTNTQTAEQRELAEASALAGW
jgi:hypothetical protein